VNNPWSDPGNKHHSQSARSIVQRGWMDRDVPYTPVNNSWSDPQGIMFTCKWHIWGMKMGVLLFRYPCPDGNSSGRQPLPSLLYCSWRIAVGVGMPAQNLLMPLRPSSPCNPIPNMQARAPLYKNTDIMPMYNDPLMLWRYRWPTGLSMQAPMPAHY
jgi:hypothetical protein